MARRRVTRSRRRSTFTIDKYTIGRGFIVLGVLYFFAYFMAPTSPILHWFHQASYIVFWKIGTAPFFAVSIIFGLMVLIKWHLMNLLTKQFLILLVLLSWIFNFPLIDKSKDSFSDFGGYISWPVLYILEQGFWSDNPMAIKWVIISLLIFLIIWIFYKFNITVPLPRVSFRIPEQKNPLRITKSTKLDSSTSSWSKNISPIRDVSVDNSPTDTEGSLIQNIMSWLKKETKDQWLLKTALKSTIAKSVDDKVHQKTMAQISFPKDKPTFSLDLLRRQKGSVEVDHELLARKAQMIQDKLMEFGVPVSIDGFDIWPSIIQIKVKPEPGIKISTIENLKQDLALATKSKALRIVAPIPWTDNIGIQIPNPSPMMVHLGDVLWSSDLTQLMQKNLMNLTLGKAIDGKNMIKSLEDMPHLLIAWATWSGKSVWVNDFILALMYQNNPNELKFLMVDPKQVELEMYAWLPYLLAPIVTQSDKALKLLQWAVEEMETRYTKLAKSRVKKLTEYNAKHPDDQLYRIVFVIDELADLMMSWNKKEVESSITRIAQKARAVGIHLIVATQRPSVNVITWLIKANMPTRIAFWVVSQVDSRTILGIKWAEDLLGKWDLLYMDPTTKFPVRIQAPFVDTDEIDAVITSLKENYMQWFNEEDIYHPEIIRILEAKPETASSQFWWGGNSDDEELVQQAMEIVLETRKASATLLQRRLWLWFARAARIMDELENRGVVWPQEWAKAREILM